MEIVESKNRILKQILDRLDRQTFEGEMVSLVPRTSSFMRLERLRRFLPVGFVDVVYADARCVFRENFDESSG